MGGIAAARGKFVIMGDADDSYDFLEIPRFRREASGRSNWCRAVDCRPGAGTVKPNAMPILHRWLGNPMFSILARRMFCAEIHDVYCGLRGFTRELHDRLQLRCTGMEFATEMIIKSSIYGARVAEVPITLHPDGRKSHKPHLKTFRDGWRTLRFFLMYSPRWLFLYPGWLLFSWDWWVTDWPCRSHGSWRDFRCAHASRLPVSGSFLATNRSSSQYLRRHLRSAKACCRRIDGWNGFTRLLIWKED